MDICINSETETSVGDVTYLNLQEPSDVGYSASRQYKDGAFRTIFKVREWFVALYNAINGTNYTAKDVTAETTLDDPLFIGCRNDVSFLIGTKLVVFMEHQSTVNRNIALRMLVYATRTYEKIIDWKKVYGEQAMKIPRPEFYVIYNGTAKAPPVQKVRLSELFEAADGINTDNLPFTLDLEVTIYNINIDSNPELLAQCEPLSEYQTFVELVRRFNDETKNLDAAMGMALEECAKRGILKKYISKPISEVKTMFLWEVDEATVREVWKDDGRMEKSLKIARAMKDKGFDIGTIAEVTELPIDEILKL